MWYEATGAAGKAAWQTKTSSKSEEVFAFSRESRKDVRENRLAPVASQKADLCPKAKCIRKRTLASRSEWGLSDATERDRNGGKEMGFEALRLAMIPECWLCVPSRLYVPSEGVYITWILLIAYLQPPKDLLSRILEPIRSPQGLLFGHLEGLRLLTAHTSHGCGSPSS